MLSELFPMEMSNSINFGILPGKQLQYRKIMNCYIVAFLKILLKFQNSSFLKPLKDCFHPFLAMFFRVYAWNENLGLNRSRHWRYSAEKATLKNFGNFTGKHLCCILFIKKIPTQVFPSEICEIFKNSFFRRTSTNDCFCLKWVE